jgi:hypothetical protein
VPNARPCRLAQNKIKIKKKMAYPRRCNVVVTKRSAEFSSHSGDTDFIRWSYLFQYNSTVKPLLHWDGELQACVSENG